MARQGRKSSRRTSRWRLRHLVAPHFLVGVSSVGLAVAAYAGTHTYLDFHAGDPDTASDCEGCHRADRDTPPPASALAERRDEPEAGAQVRDSRAASPVRVVHRARTDAGGGFHSVLVLTNTGPEPVRHWRLTFTYPDGRVRTATATAARLRHGGRTPQLYGTGAHRTLAPGETVRIRLTGEGVAAAPYECVLNGRTCEFG